MSSQGKDLVLRHHEEVWSKGNLDAVDELYAPDFVGHHPRMPDWVGPEAVKQAVQTMRGAFPDFTESVEDVIGEGDRIVTRFTSSGTHLGMLRGIAPTGKRIAMAEIGIFRVAGGKIAEKWGLFDRLGMFQELGVVPDAWPPLEFLYEITMPLEEGQDVGAAPGGHRRIFHVKGGAFEGPKLKGVVLPGGGDWTLGRSDGSSRLDVRITLRTDDGHLIYAHYPGILYRPPDVVRRLREGESIQPTEYYFRTAPFFETASVKYDWLNRVVAMGIGERTETGVAYRVYAVL